MEKIKRFIGFLSQIPNDKLLHSFYGTIIYLILTIMFTKLISLIFIILIAISKEVYDEYVYNGFDIKDIIATILIPVMISLIN